MRRLNTAYESKDGRYATHICILCTQQQTSNPYAEPDAWESGLYRAGHTTNALDHMYAIHRDHPIGQAVAASKMKNASRQIDEAMAEARSRESKRSSSTVTNRPSKQRGTLQKLWAPTQKELGVFTAYWLINAGLPHHTIASEDFKLLIQRATGDSDATIISASTYRDLLRAVFCKFCKMATNLLLSEFDAALRTPFLNLHHGIWTTANGKKGMLGTSACLLLSVTNGSHASLGMKRTISFRMKELYSIDIDSMTQFAVSDTTASARKVSKLFEDALPTDCHMHILNLCLQYAIGIRENKETVSVYDPKTGAKTRKKRYCTVGGEFKKGRLLIKAVRDLNNHFSTDQRCKGLEDVQDFFSLPKLKTTVDCETRVAYTVKLFQHSIVNYSAFQGYFKKRGEEGGESVFNNLTHADWKLMAEMEAIEGSFADLARAEVQRNDLVASELVVLLKYTEKRLYCYEFMIYDIDSPRFTTTTVASFPRFNVPVEHLSDLGQRCLARLKGQVEKRLAKATPETVMILLLDPRTKFSVKALIRPTKTHADVRADEANDDADETKFIQDIIAAGTKLLTDAHREVFCAMNALSNDAVESAAPVSSANLDLVPTAEEGEAICGAPIKSTTPGTTPATLLEQADKKLEEWLTYSVDWAAITGDAEYDSRGSHSDAAGSSRWRCLLEGRSAV